MQSIQSKGHKSIGWYIDQNLIDKAKETAELVIYACETAKTFEQLQQNINVAAVSLLNSFKNDSVEELLLDKISKRAKSFLAGYKNKTVQNLLLQNSANLFIQVKALNPLYDLYSDLQDQYSPEVIATCLKV